MVASSTYTQPAQEPPESPLRMPDFYRIEVWCVCGECSFRVKSIRLTAAGVKWKGWFYPEHHCFPSVYSSMHPPPCSALWVTSSGSLPSPKTQCLHDAMLQGRGLGWVVKCDAGYGSLAEPRRSSGTHTSARLEASKLWDMGHGSALNAALCIAVAVVLFGGDRWLVAPQNSESWQPQKLT